MTKAYTFEVNLIVQVIAEDEAAAKLALDQSGGYVSKRESRVISEASLSSGSALTLIKN